VPSIRNIAVGLPVRDGHVLVLHGRDPAKRETFTRAIGGWAVLSGTVVASRPRLGDALDLLDGRLSTTAPAAGPDRLGAWVRTRLNRPVSATTERRLRMTGRSVERHYTTKTLLAAGGLTVPLLAAANLHKLDAWEQTLPKLDAQGRGPIRPVTIRRRDLLGLGARLPNRPPCVPREAAPVTQAAKLWPETTQTPSTTI